MQKIEKSVTPPPYPIDLKRSGMNLV